MAKGQVMWSRKPETDRDGGGITGNGTLRSGYQMKWHERVRIPRRIGTRTIDIHCPHTEQRGNHWTWGLGKWAMTGRVGDGSADRPFLMLNQAALGL